MDKIDIYKEMIKCRKSPYYLATTYMKIKDKDGNLIPFTTCLTKEQFNKFYLKQ